MALTTPHVPTVLGKNVIHKNRHPLPLEGRLSVADITLPLTTDFKLSIDEGNSPPTVSQGGFRDA